MIEVTGPDGAIHEFPDETSPDVIKGVMARHYGAPQPAAKPSGSQPSKQDRGAIDAALRAAANAATFGFNDRLKAAVGSALGFDSYGNILERGRARDVAAAEQHPIASTVGGVAGSFAPAFAIPGAGGAMSAGARALTSGGVGAGMGALSGAASSPDLTDVRDVARRALRGGAIGGAGGAVIGGAVENGARALAGAKRPAVPTAEELYGASDAAYDAARNLGVDYRSAAVADMARQAEADLVNQGIIRELSPKTYAVLDKLQNPPQGSVANFTGIEAARRGFSKAARDFNNPTEQGCEFRCKPAGDSDFIPATVPN